VELENLFSILEYKPAAPFPLHLHTKFIQASQSSRGDRQKMQYNYVQSHSFSVTLPTNCHLKSMLHDFRYIHTWFKKNVQQQWKQLDLFKMRSFSQQASELEKNFCESK
jgi:hypothetical protein